MRTSRAVLSPAARGRIRGGAHHRPRPARVVRRGHPGAPCCGKLIFLTHDTEFEDLPVDYLATVIISRVPQSLPTNQRVESGSRPLRGSSRIDLRDRSSTYSRAERSFRGKRVRFRGVHAVLPIRRGCQAGKDPKRELAERPVGGDELGAELLARVTEDGGQELHLSHRGRIRARPRWCGAMSDNIAGGRLGIADDGNGEFALLAFGKLATG